MLFRYYRSKDVEKITGVTRRQLAYWLRCGVIESHGRSSTGRGSPRLFTFNDLVTVKLTKDLLEGGLKVGKIKKCVAAARKKIPELTENPLTALHVFTDGKDVYRYIAEQQAEDLLSGQLAFIFSIDKQISDVVKALEISKTQRVNKRRAS